MFGETFPWKDKTAFIHQDQIDRGTVLIDIVAGNWCFL